MIPFLATQLERGAGTTESVIRPIVPSMFETSPSIADPLQEDAAEHSPSPQSVIADIRTGREPARAELPFESVTEASRERPWPSFIADREPSTPDQRFTPSALEWTTLAAELASRLDPPAPPSIAPHLSPAGSSVSSPQFDRRSEPAASFQELAPSTLDWTTPAAGPGSRFDPPAPPSIAPPLVPVVSSVLQSQIDQRSGPSESEAEDARIPQNPTPASPLHDLLESEFSVLRRRIDSLAQLHDVPVILPAIEAIATKPTLAPPSIGSSREQRESGPTALSQGIVPQQAIPQIQTPQEPSATPTITVSIGRIEFRNSSRRTEPTPATAASPQRPASRVMSLEDYLRSRSAGGH